MQILNIESGQARSSIYLQNRSSRTGTVINFANVFDNTGGTGMTLSQGGGDSITINEDGIYYCTISGAATGGGSIFGVTRNDTSLSISSNNTLISISEETADRTSNGAWAGFLSSGDVIRALDDAGTGTASTFRFTICQLYKV